MRELRECSTAYELNGKEDWYLPTMVPGPRSPARKLLPQISMTESRISGELLPRAMRVRLATVSFHLKRNDRAFKKLQWLGRLFMAINLHFNFSVDELGWIIRIRIFDYLRFACDFFDSTHKNISYDCNAQEQVEKSGHVNDSSDPCWPRVFAYNWKEQR